MGSIWSSSPLKPWRVPGNSSIHRLGMDPSQARRLWLGPTFPLGFLAELREFSTGAKTPSIAATSWGTGETWTHRGDMNSRKAFFWLDEMYVPVFFLFGVGGLCVGFIHLIVCFWFGWDKMKVQQVKIEQYKQDIDCRCWMSAFDEFCLFGLLKHWRIWKWMKLCNSGDQIWLKRKFIPVLLKPLQLKKGSKKKQWKNDKNTYFRHILTSLLQWCWILLRLSNTYRTGKAPCFSMLRVWDSSANKSIQASLQL